MSGESVAVLADGILLTYALAVLMIPLLAWLHEQPPHQPPGREREQTDDAETSSRLSSHE